MASARKACNMCRAIYDSNECPVCKSNQSTTNWKGRLFITNPEKSEIAKKLGMKKSHEYAIKLG